jgi:hypothetical protein
MKKMISNNINDYPDSDLLFPSRYVKAAEVKQVGRQFPLTIKKIEPRHELQKKGSGKEYKPALFFRETEKAMVLNKTNAKRIAEALGKDPRKWIGCRIVPCVERVDSFGKEVEAIRIDVDATAAANRAKGAPVPQQEQTPQREPGWDDLGAPDEPDEAELARQALEAEQA